MKPGLTIMLYFVGKKVIKPGHIAAVNFILVLCLILDPEGERKYWLSIFVIYVGRVLMLEFLSIYLCKSYNVSTLGMQYTCNLNQIIHIYNSSLLLSARFGNKTNCFFFGMAGKRLNQVLHFIFHSLI